MANFLINRNSLGNDPNKGPSPTWLMTDVMLAALGKLS